MSTAAAPSRIALLVGPRSSGSGIALLMLFALTACSGSKRKEPPQVDQGVVDLRGWDFQRDGPAELCGGWRFAWNKDDPRFRKPNFDDRDWSTFRVPRPWRGHLSSGMGYGWYRARVRVTPQKGLGFDSTDPLSAYRIYVNGVLKGQVGRPGTRREDERPYYEDRTFALPRADEYVIAIQVSNFHGKGGFLVCPKIGVHARMVAQEWEDDVVAILVLGFILMSGVFCLLFWLGRPEDRAPLFFALLAFDIAIRLFMTGHFFDRLFESWDIWALRWKLEYWGISLGAFTALGFFYHLYPRDFSLRIVRILQGLALLCTAFILVTPYRIFGHQLLLINLVLLLSLGYCISMLVICIRRGRGGVWPLVAGFVIGALSVASQILYYHTGVGSARSADIGFMLFFAIQTSVLAVRYARSYQTAERLTAHLQQEVEKTTEALTRQSEEAREARAHAEHAAERIHKSDREKSDFFQNVSQELRSPLTRLIAPLEQLRAGDPKGRSPEALREQLGRMEQNGQRLLRLVNQLLDYTQLESGHLQILFSEAHVPTLLAPAMTAFEDVARRRGVRLDLRAADPCPPVWVDPEVLEMAFSNLLSNALKFSAEGGSVLVRVDADAEELHIAVKDTGAGIPPDVLPHLFERNSRTEEEAERAPEGTGIGLVLAQDRLRRCGGHITVQSEPGLGSTFTIHLPRGDEHVDRLGERATERDDARIGDSVALALAAEMPPPGPPAVAAPAKRPAPPSGDTAPVPPPEPTVDTALPAEDGARLTVLIVDDNADMRHLIRNLLQADFDVTEAADGVEGLAQLREQPPAVVIADVMMPNMDGHEMLQHIRQDPDTASTPVLILTARDDAASRKQSLAEGADDYLSKPFDLQELKTRVGNLARRRRQEAALREANLELRSRTADLQQETVRQSLALERAKQLGRSLPPAVVQAVLDGDKTLGLEREQRSLCLFRIELKGLDIGKLEPTDLTAVLNGYLTAMMERAHNEGATVDRVVRDRVSGFFGAPQSAGSAEDAKRAVHLAAALWQDAQEICQRWAPLLDGPLPQPTVVVHTGPATVGPFGPASRLEYTAVGLGPDQLDALMAAVEPGRALYTQATHDQLPPAARGRDGGEVTLPGETTPLCLYRIPHGDEGL